MIRYKSELVDTNYGPEMRVEIYENGLLMDVVQEPMTAKMIVDMWKRENGLEKEFSSAY